jgi:hypothetical protein
LASSDNTTNVPDSGAVLAPEVASCHLEVEESRFKLGESLRTRIHVTFSNPVRLGQMLFCLLDNAGRFVARGTCDLTSEKPVSGAICIRLCLKNLRLAVGEYKIQILCFSQQPAMQLINYSHPQPVFSESAIVSEVRYQPEATHDLVVESSRG